MNAQEYAAEQQQLSAQAGSLAMKYAHFVLNPVLTTVEWLAFLQLLFPTIERIRYQASDLARTFVDSERKLFNPTLPRHDVFLEHYDFPRFVANMEPTRKQLTQALSPQNAVTNLVMHTVREVEDGGRQQIINAVESDFKALEVVPGPDVAPKPDSSAIDKMKRDIAESAGRVEPAPAAPENLTVKPSGPVRGWARVATGKETCSFCLMLISRGPVYLSAKGAGLDLHDAGAAAALSNGEDVSQWMNQWHIGCDCKVVPVYDKLDWPGMDAANRALELWKTASLEARQVLKDNPGKTSFVGGKWVPTTLNRETINSLRRRLDSGDISAKDYAALSAA